MEPKDGKGPGDTPTPKKKRAPSARKRTAKAVKAAEQAEPPTTERELAPEAKPQPAQTQPAQTQQGDADRGSAEVRDPGKRTSQERAVPLDGQGDEHFGDRDAEHAADVAADLKSWMDTRREDRDQPREVL